MPMITRTVTSKAPVADAYGYLSDFSNAPEWDPGTVSSIPRDQSGPRVGQVYDLVVTWGDRSLPMVYEVTDLEADRVITLRGEGSTTTAVDTITFAETENGETLVTYTADIRLKGLLRLAEPFLGGKFKSLGDEAEHGILTQLTRLT